MSLADDILAEVQRNTSVKDSAKALLKNLHDLLGSAGTDESKLAQIKDLLHQNDDDLAQAIVDNTPASDPAQPPAPTQAPPASGSDTGTDGQSSAPAGDSTAPAGDGSGAPADAPTS